MRRKLLFPLVCMLILVIVACSDDNSSQPDLESARDSNVNTPTPLATTPLAEDDTPQQNPTGYRGILLYVHENMLYRWDMETQAEPESLMNDLFGASAFANGHFTVAPDKQYVIVATLRGQSYDFHRIDPRTGEITNLLQETMRGSFFRDNYSPINIVSWSPNQEWLLFRIEASGAGQQSARYRTVVVKSDGSQIFDLWAGNEFPQIRWLEDNTLVILDYSGLMIDEENNGFALVLNGAQYFDLATGELTTIEIDLETPSESNFDVITEYNFQAETLIEDSVGVRFANSELLVPPNGLQAVSSDDATRYIIDVPQNYSPFLSGTTYCSDWTISSFEYNGNNPPQTVVVEESVGFLDRLHVLNDGSLVYSRYRYPDCDTGGVPMGELIRVLPEGDAVILTDRLSRPIDRNLRNVWSENVIRFAISPDEQTIFWIESDDLGLENFLFSFDFETGEVIPVMVDGEQLTNIDSMVWLPATSDSGN